MKTFLFTDSGYDYQYSYIVVHNSLEEARTFFQYHRDLTYEWEKSEDDSLKKDLQFRIREDTSRYWLEFMYKEDGDKEELQRGLDYLSQAFVSIEIPGIYGEEITIISLDDLESKARKDENI